MSPPEYFKVEYSINPWMVAGATVDLDLAKNQWNNLKSTIEEAGAEVKVVPPSEAYPDLVFTANSGIINDKEVLIATLNMKKDVVRKSFTQTGLMRMAIVLDAYLQNINLKEEVTHLYTENT